MGRKLEWNPAEERGAKKLTAAQLQIHQDGQGQTTGIYSQCSKTLSGKDTRLLARVSEQKMVNPGPVKKQHLSSVSKVCVWE